MEVSDGGNFEAGRWERIGASTTSVLAGTLINSAGFFSAQTLWIKFGQHAYHHVSGQYQIGTSSGINQQMTGRVCFVSGSQRVNWDSTWDLRSFRGRSIDMLRSQQPAAVEKLVETWYTIENT